MDLLCKENEVLNISLPLLSLLTASAGSKL